MNLFTVEVGLLCIVGLLLVAFAIRMRKRLQIGDDFILGRRRLGARLGGISIAICGIPMWWLLLLVSTAYAAGRSAVWLALALLGGVMISGWSLAPRLRARSQMQQYRTLSQLLAGDAGEKMYAMLMRSAALIAGIVLMLTLVAQLQLVAAFVAEALATSPNTVITVAVSTFFMILLIAGLWVAVIGDALQVALFLGVGTATIIAMLFGRNDTIAASWSAGDWFGDQRGLLTVSFLVGIGFLVGDAMGQSSLLTRFMACKDDADLIVARKTALLLSAVAATIALAVGWLARAMGGSEAPSINAFTDLLLRALPPKAVALFILSILLALGIAMGNGLLAVASHLASDLRRANTPLSLLRCRLWLAVACIVAVGLAMYLPRATPQGNFDRMLFCWHAAGAAFGPLLIVRLTGKRIRPGSTLGAMWSGFLLTIVFHLLPDTPGDLLERSLPFTASLGIALSGGERRRNPDRADRGDRTIHDRLPI